MGLALRAVWFVTIGWLLGILWFFGALMLMGTIVFFPVGAYLAAKTWAVMTLKRRPTVVLHDARAEAN